MNDKLLEMLSRVTEEEKQILAGQSDIDRRRYTDSKDFTIDSGRVMKGRSLIDIRPHTRFVHFPEHKHNYVEVIYMCSGCLKQIINGQENLALRAGEILFLNQSVYHEILPAGQGDVALNFIIQPQFFDTALNMLERQSTIYSFLISTLSNPSGKGQYLHFKVSGVLPVQNLIENMAWSIINNRENERISRINEYTMALLLLQLADCSNSLDKNNPNQYEYWLTMSVMKYIDEQYQSARLEELAQSLNQSIYRLSRFIKSSTGHTFKELLQQKRMAVAAQLLSHTDLSVTEIIAAVGYSNTSYFHRAFRQTYSVTPKVYRKSI